MASVPLLKLIPFRDVTPEDEKELSDISASFSVEFSRLWLSFKVELLEEPPALETVSTSIFSSSASNDVSFET